MDFDKALPFFFYNHSIEAVRKFLGFLDNFVKVEARVYAPNGKHWKFKSEIGLVKRINKE